MNDFDIIDRALMFAAGAHGSQQYGQSKPYLYHLDQVADELSRHGCNRLLPGEFAPGFTHRQMLAAAYLHDTLEDTTVTPEMLETHFGPQVRQLVEHVSDPKGLPRRERKRISLPRVRELAGAVALKLADRKVNVQESLMTNSKLLSMYVKEHKEFHDVLWVGGEWPSLWWDLNDLISKAKLVQGRN